MRITTIAVFIFSLFFLNSNSFGAKHDRNRQHRQGARIKQGVHSGSLTKEEAKNLRQEQREIRKDRKDAMADGKMTKEERKEIQKEQNEASKNIYEEKHDSETQGH